MWKYILIASSLLTFGAVNAQTSLFSEDFETGGGGFDLNSTAEGSVTMDVGFNQWIVNGVYGGGAFTETCLFSDVGVNAVPAQPAGISSAGGSYMHIYSDVAAMLGGGTNCNFQTVKSPCSNAQTHFAEMSSDVSTVGKTDVTVDFWWLCDGNAFAYGELYYSTDGAATWTQVGPSAGALDEYREETTWVEESVTSTDFDGHAQIRFGFRFVTLADFGSYTNMLAFGIDDFEITATDDPGCTATTNSFSVDACDTYTVPSSDETYTTSGTVMDTIPNAGGCDSVMTITVNIITIDNSVSATSTTLTANDVTSGVTYQWVDCNDSYAAISGATSALFSPTANGSYAVVVANGACSDTSDCNIISNLGIETSENNLFTVYPNPTEDGTVFIQTNGNEAYSINIYNVLSKVVFTGKTSGTTTEINLNANSGIYFIQLKDNSGEITTRKISVK